MNNNYTYEQIKNLCEFAGLGLTTLWNSKNILLRGSEDGREFGVFGTSDDGKSYSFQLYPSSVIEDHRRLPRVKTRDDWLTKE